MLKMLNWKILRTMNIRYKNQIFFHLCHRSNTEKLHSGVDLAKKQVELQSH